MGTGNRLPRGTCCLDLTVFGISAVLLTACVLEALRLLQAGALGAGLDWW